jgi:hypothetical protein
MALSEYQQRQLERAENEWLREPEYNGDDSNIEPEEVDAYKQTCSLCNCYPDDDFLYFVDGEWICADCLLDQFKRRDIYTGEVRL